MSTWLNDGIEIAVQKVSAQVSRGGDFPHITEGSKWQTTPDGVWTGGFWAGLVWMAYAEAKDDALLSAARSLTDRLLPRAEDTINHDLGFMFYPSAVQGWRVTGDSRYLKAALAAAESLVSQFNPQGGFIPGWGFFGGENWSGSALIDTLMNLPLLVWAANQEGNTHLLDVAHRHARTALANFQREDGSVFHMYKFDPADGTPIEGATYQGQDASSAWSRGQGWALAGFAMLADMTGTPEYLLGAQRVAEYIERHLPADRIPPWDYSAGCDAVKDSSAGAISAYGLLRLWGLTHDAHYLELAETMLAALCKDCLIRSDSAPILGHATADLPHGLGIDESTIYGDYYFLKALLALRAIKTDGAERAGGEHGALMQTSAE